VNVGTTIGVGVPVLLAAVALIGYGAYRRGASSFSRGALFHLLRNPIYRGMIRHKGLLHQGGHEAITHGKRGQVYRYYVTSHLQQGLQSEKTEQI